MLKIDLHLHTVASGHAYNTVLEYINQAKKLKMKIIGISDHGPGSGEVNEVYFRCLRRIPRLVNNVMILRGIEANIINKKGDIDISDKVIKRLDYVMANFHEGTPYKDLGIKRNTAALIRTIKSGKVKIISHPFYNKAAPVDMSQVSEEACKNNILLEITTHGLQKCADDPKIFDNLKIMVDVARKNNKKIIISSDAHNIWEMGDDKILQKIKKEIGLADKMIINNNGKELLKFLNISV